MYKWKWIKVTSLDFQRMGQSQAEKCKNTKISQILFIINFFFEVRSIQKELIFTVFKSHNFVHAQRTALETFSATRLACIIPCFISFFPDSFSVKTGNPLLPHTCYG